MRKILITCRSHPAEGAWWDLYLLTSERMRRYAALHGYEYRDVFYDDFDRAEWPGLFSGRLPVWPFNPQMTSPCWMKIPAINVAFRDHDVVVYLDNDVSVLDFDRDILDDLPDGKVIGMPNSTTPEGTGPNIGIVVTRRSEDSMRFWRAAWDIDAWKTAKWTDNGQVMALLGYSTSPPLVHLGDTEYTPVSQVLGQEWVGFGGGAAPGELLTSWRVFHAAWGRDGQWKLDVSRSAIAQREGEKKNGT